MAATSNSAFGKRSYRQRPTQAVAALAKRSWGSVAAGRKGLGATQRLSTMFLFVRQTTLARLRRRAPRLVNAATSIAQLRWKTSTGINVDTGINASNADKRGYTAPLCSRSAHLISSPSTPPKKNSRATRGSETAPSPTGATGLVPTSSSPGVPKPTSPRLRLLLGLQSCGSRGWRRR
jgi:hypothetical protein